MIYDIYVCDNETMQEWKAGLKTRPDSRIYEGFQIFNDSVTSRSIAYDHIFFIAVYNDQIVGVLKCSDTRISLQEKIWSVSWIDVHQNYKRRGIARSLYTRLNEWLDESFILIGTPLEPEGEQAHLYELRRSIITRCPNYDNRQSLIMEKIFS